MADEGLVIRARGRSGLTRNVEVTQNIVERVEIARSATYKLNCAHYGGNQYESQDFFCSQKAECAPEDAPDVSEALYQFCRGEVRRAVAEAIADLKRRKVQYGA